MSQKDDIKDTRRLLLLLPLNLHEIDAIAEAGDRREVSQYIFRDIKNTSRGRKGRCFSDRTHLDNEQFRADMRTDSDAGILRGGSYAETDFSFLRMFVSLKLTFMLPHGITLTRPISSNLCQFRGARGGHTPPTIYFAIFWQSFWWIIAAP